MVNRKWKIGGYLWLSWGGLQKHACGVFLACGLRAKALRAKQSTGLFGRTRRIVHRPLSAIKKAPVEGAFLMAERGGFEPPIGIDL